MWNHPFVLRFLLPIAIGVWAVSKFPDFTSGAVFSGMAFAILAHLLAGFIPIPNKRARHIAYSYIPGNEKQLIICRKLLIFLIGMLLGFFLVQTGYLSPTTSYAIAIFITFGMVRMVDNYYRLP